MSRYRPALLAFNRGLVSRLALARTDLQRLQLSAETQTNWMPRTLGSMSLRPGLKYTGATKNNAQAWSIPFIYEINDQARLELTANVMRIWVDDALISRESVTTSITNGTFDTTISGWTDDDEGGTAVSGFATGGYMSLTGDSANAAVRYQSVTIASVDRATEHGLRVVVERGPVTVAVGTSSGDDSIMAATVLATGTHSLAFTPGTGTIVITVSNRNAYEALLDSISIEAAGAMEVPTPWPTAALPYLRWAQSRDVVFVACDGYQQRRIERRSSRSWSIVLYETEDGPFRDENLTRVTLTPSARTGDITLTASSDVFNSGMVGSLFRMESSGQNVSVTVGAENTFTSPGVRVTGTGTDRAFTIVTGSTSSTITLQRAIGEDLEALYEDVQTVAASTTLSFDDDLDNQIIFYRIGVKTGDYVDAATASITYTRGSIVGYVRVHTYTSTTEVDARVLSPLGSTDATSIWAEGEWSAYRGFPTAVELFEGRLWWGGRGKLWGSVSDAFTSFDADVEGDSGPIGKFISDGPSDVVPWLAGGQRLLMGTAGSVFEARSSSLDEPLTPTACALRRFSTAGASNIPAVVEGARVLFVPRANTELHEASVTDGGFQHAAVDLSSIVPEIGEPAFTRIARQDNPDTRIHCVRSDGTAAVLVTDELEEVRCWIEIETDGLIEDVCILPTGGAEDAVYYTVARTVGGSTVRYHERWALESECVGGSLNKQADSFISYTGGATNTINGLDHLEGETVVIWADGTSRGTATVTSGAVTVPGSPCFNAVIGLAYTASYKSSKLAYAAAGGAALTQTKKVHALGLIMADTHATGVQYGQDFDTLDDLPTVEDFAAVDADTVHTAYDERMFPFGGSWDTDARLCLRANAPKPVTILAAVLDIETAER